MLSDRKYNSGNPNRNTADNKKNSENDKQRFQIWRISAF